LGANPFAGLAKSEESMAINAFQLKPGVGLYILAVALLLATLFSYSRRHAVVPSSASVTESYAAVGGGGARVLGFVALFAVIGGAAFAVLTHKAHSVENKQNGIRRSTQPDHSSSLSEQRSEEYAWPREGLPVEVSNALATPDLAPEQGRRSELTLDTSGQKQFISTGMESAGECGSGGCAWDIHDANTQSELLNGLGSIHKTQAITGGYFDLLEEGKDLLILYEFNGEKYLPAECYTRSNGPGSSAIPTPCP
jgi:hypothetical protein